MDDFAKVSELKFADQVTPVNRGAEPYMAMPDETVSPEPKPPFTERMLELDGKFAASARDVYYLMEGEPFEGDNLAATKYGIDLMTEFNFNFAGPAGIPGESGVSSPGMVVQAATMLASGTEDQAKSFVYMMDQYERLPMFTMKGTGRAVRAMLGDASLYAGLGTLGAGLVARKAGVDTTKLGIRKALMAIGNNPIKATAGFTAAESGLSEKALIEMERKAGYEISPEEEALRLGITTGVGSAVGAGLAGVGKAVAPQVARGVDAAGNAAQRRIAEREADTGVTLGAGVDPTPAIDKAIVGVQKAMGGKAHPNRIATRLPTAVKSEEDPIVQPLQIGLEESKADPVQFEHNVGLVQKYPNLTEAESKLPPEQGSEAFINHVKDNLLWIHDKIPEETRQRSKLWYDGARAITDRWSKQYNLPDSSVAGILAALSPQMDWYKNVSLAERVITTMGKTDVPASKEMIEFAKRIDPKTKKPKLAAKFQPIIDDMLGKTLNDLDTPLKKAIFVRLYDEVNNPRSHNVISPEGDLMGVVKKADGSEAGTGWGSFVEITKAVEAYQSGGDKAILTPLMGTQHKVRSFYNNILDPNGPSGDVTIDTHAVAAGLLKPLSGASTEVHHNFGSAPSKAQRGENWTGQTKNSSVTGVQGNYGLYAEAYRRAAAERGILPREMQSITWEAARGLFTDVYKRQKQGDVMVNVKAVDDFWKKYRKGEMTIDEVRNAIEQHAGGINPPTWKE